MKQALGYFRSERRAIVTVAVLSFVGANIEALALILLIPIAQAIANGETTYTAHVAGISGTFTVRELIGTTALAIVLAAAFNYSTTYLRIRSYVAWERRQRDAVVSEFFDADWPTQAADRSGNLQTLVTYVKQASGALGAMMGAIKSLLTVVIFVGLAFVIDWRAALLIIVIGVVLFGVLRPLVNRIRSASRRIAHHSREYAQELGEISASARDITVFDARDQIETRVRTVSDDMARDTVYSAFLSACLSPTYQYGGMLFVLAALLVANNLSDVNVAAIGAIALLLLRSLSYGQMLQIGYQSVIETMPYIEYLEELRETYRENRAPEGSEVLPPVQEIRLDDVRYSYDGAHQALDGVSLTLRHGAIVGVVGPSGSGKSTLTQLLLRLRRPDQGAVLVNGVPADEFTRSSWYRRISLVPQDPKLLHATVLENITLFSTEITREQAVDAARDAGIHDLIMSLDEGYDTPIGAAVRDLSGGQIQRIGIARALARRPDVLVLDEPTSALDVHTEALIQDALHALRGESLLVVIAHRLSTLAICDELLVLEKGRLTAAGTLAEVREVNPFFRKALETGTLDVDRAAG